MPYTRWPSLLIGRPASPNFAEYPFHALGLIGAGERAEAAMPRPLVPPPAWPAGSCLLFEPLPHMVRMARCVDSEAHVRATAVESPAELLVEPLPAALRLAQRSRSLVCSPQCLARRPLRLLRSAAHQEGPLSGCSLAP